MVVKEVIAFCVQWWISGCVISTDEDARTIICRAKRLFEERCPEGVQDLWLNESEILFTVADENECASNPCNGAGACVDLRNSYLCDCVQGATGKYCERSEC